MLFVLWFCALSAFASIRTLTEGERDLLCTIWGVRDTQALIDLTNNPQKFWDDRRKDLLEGPNRVINHFAFCQRYIAEAKTYITQKLAKCIKRPWFQDPEDIDRVIKDYVSEDHGGFMQLRLTLFAKICDALGGVYDRKIEHLHPDVIKKHADRKEECERIMQSEDWVRAILASEKLYGYGRFCSCTHEFVRWMMVPDGKFSLIDSLVLLGEGLYLCSVSSDPEERANSYVHEGQYSGWYGAYEHDVLAHANCANALAEDFSKLGILYQDYLNSCCNPGALAAGNLITMSLQVMAWFTQFHELPSAEGAYVKGDLISMLFPSIEDVSDQGFMRIATYFMQPPLKDNWIAKPLRDINWPQWLHQCCVYPRPTAIVASEVVNKHLLGWRSQYCFQGIRFLNLEDMDGYLTSLERDLSYLKPSDLDRYPQFFIEVLGRLRMLDIADGAICSLDFGLFADRARSLAIKCGSFLDKFASKRKTLYLIIPYCVRFLLITSCADHLRQAQSRTNVIFARVKGCGWDCLIVDEKRKDLARF